MSTKITCDRCRVKDGIRRHIDTCFKVFNLDLCDDCHINIGGYIKNYLMHREKMDDAFGSFILNPQPGALEAIMGKYGFDNKTPELLSQKGGE